MKKIYLFLLLLFASITGYASHLVGGDLRVVFRNQTAAGPLYRIVFNLYYNDGPAPAGVVPLPQVAILVITSKRTGATVGNNVTVQKRSRISTTYPNVSPGCPTTSVVNTGIYLYDVELVLDPAIYNEIEGYYVTCITTDFLNARNSAVINIQPNSFAYYTEFPRVTNSGVAPFSSFVNSSPDFGSLKGDYLCINQPFSADYSTTDIDGDQLEYDLVDPLDTAPSTPSTWQPGYSLDNIFGVVSIANRMRIDRLTGLVTVTPNAAGLFAFSVRCTERRNGVKIGEVRREFQYLVRATCDPALIPVPSVPGLNTTSTGAYILDLNNSSLFKLEVKASNNKKIRNVQIIPQSANLNENDLAKIRVRTEGTGTGPAGLPPTVALGDPNLLLSINPLGIANLIIEWSECLYSKTATNTYDFDLIITDNSCPNANTSTTKIKLKVLQRNNPAPKWEIINTKNIAIIDQYGSINATSTPILATGKDTVRFTVVGRDIGDMLRIRARAASDGEYFTFTPKGIKYTTPQLVAKDVVYSDFEWVPTCDLVRKNGRREEIVIDIFIEERTSCDKLRTTLKVKLILEDNGVTSDYQPVNVITPNGDGKNEFYTLSELRNATCLYKFKKISIHNRFGKEVFQSGDEKFAWNAEEYPTGLYYYRIEYDNYEYKGSLQVLR